MPIEALGALIFAAILLGVYAMIPPQETLPISEASSALQTDLPARRRRTIMQPLEWLGKLSPKFGRHRALSDQLLYAGSWLTTDAFYGVKIAAALGGCLVFSVIAFEFGWSNPPVYIGAAVVGFIAPDMVLRSKLQKRNKAILRLLPETIDLLALCVGAGLDFVLALNRIISIPQYQHEPLTQELTMALQEMKLGKRRGDALKTMGRRVNIPEVSSFVRTIVQADKMGTPIAQVLAVHAEDVRSQRFIRAERQALKAPLKILVPLIFCIMPCVAIIVGAPVFLQFMKQNPFAK